MSKKPATRSESQRKLWRVPLASITTSNNTRNPVSAEMQKAGHVAFPAEGGEAGASLWEHATCTDDERRKAFVNLIDEHEAGEGGIKELASSILTNGLVNPITLRENRGGESFSIVAGARRALAAAYNWCRGAGQGFIEAAVNKDNNTENLYRGIAENSCRKNPNLMERARACQMAVNGGSTTAEIAEREGCSEQTIKNRLRLLELEPKHQRAVAEGRMTLTKALDLLRNAEPEPQTTDGKDAAVYDDTVQAERKRVRKYKEVFDRYNTLVSEIDRDKMDPADRREAEVLAWVLRLGE